MGDGYRPFEIIQKKPCPAEFYDRAFSPELPLEILDVNLKGNRAFGGHCPMYFGESAFEETTVDLGLMCN